MKDVAVVIVAAGSGSRFGRPKQFELLGGEPLFLWPVRTFLTVNAVSEVILVHSPEHREEMAKILMGANLLGRVRLVAGGATRQDSTANGVRAISPTSVITLVHDAARALIDLESIEATIEACRSHQAALVALPVVDTIKQVEDHRVQKTISRTNLWRAQTPQGAVSTLLLKALETANEESYQGTDEAELLERIGVQVRIIPGKESNFKITYPDDLERAESFLKAKLDL